MAWEDLSLDFTPKIYQEALLLLLLLLFCDVMISDGSDTWKPCIKFVGKWFFYYLIILLCQKIWAHNEEMWYPLFDTRKTYCDLLQSGTSHDTQKYLRVKKEWINDTYDTEKVLQPFFYVLLFLYSFDWSSRIRLKVRKFL